MKEVTRHLAILLLLLPFATAQNAGTATVQSVTATRQGDDLRVEIKLSGAVKPIADTAIGPDRILLDLPGAVCNDSTKNVPVNLNGVRRVRTGQHSTQPMVTRVVLDLDQAHPYTMRTEGNRIILTVGPAEIAQTGSHSGAPVAATSGNIIPNVFRRKQDGPTPVIEADTTPVPVPEPPPASSGPAFEPSQHKSAADSLPAPPPAVAPSQSASQTASSVASSNPTPPATVAPTVSITTKPVQLVPTPPAAVAPSQPAAQTASSVAPSNPAPPAAVAPVVSVATTPVQSVPTPPAAVQAPPQPVQIASAAKPENPPSEAASSSIAPAAPQTVPTQPEEAVPAPVPTSSAPDASVSETEMLIARADDPSLHTVFRIKYVAEGVAYLDGGHEQGLTEGMKLEVIDKNAPARQGSSVNTGDPRIVAELEVTAVADTSAVTDVHTPKRTVKVGDLAYLSSGDAEALVQQRALSATRQYPAVISFTEGDTLDEEVRQEVPRPPLPSVNRARGRIGFDDIETISHGTSSVTSTDVGVVFRGDITRIGGSYWNVSGYWRGRLTKESAASQQTLQSLINRTYTLNMTYDNPNSTLVAGFGRLYLPWAPSLDTIDGGYFGDRLSKGTVLGIFGGSTPDPSSWDYNPNRALGGAFINFEGGDYNAFHYSATTGAAMSMVNWASNDPFVFIEDSVSYKRDIAVYESAQFDAPKGNAALGCTTCTPAPGPGLGRNFFTLRVNPHPRLELNANYNYFRQIPTFDPTLIGTGLLDKYLFQGFSAGGRLEVFNQFWVSTNLGRSTGTGDAKASLNQMYGITYGRIPWIDMRADLRYSRFNSSFGNGSYEALTMSRQMSDRLRVELLLGQQVFASPLTTNTHSKFLTGTVETTFGPHYYLQSNFTTNRGDMSYDQLMFSMGYRFDSKSRQ